MEIKVVTLGAHMPLSTRRVLGYFGKSTKSKTAIGLVEGLADGAVLVRDFAKGTHYEITPAQAKAAGEALKHAAYAIEQWQEHASGFNRVRVHLTPDGQVSVTHRGRTRTMRLSKLRGQRWHDGSLHFYAWCGACRRTGIQAIYVASDIVREHGSKVPHVKVCPDCIEKLANLPETIAEVTPIAGEAT